MHLLLAILRHVPFIGALPTPVARTFVRFFCLLSSPTFGLGLDECLFFSVLDRKVDFVIHVIHPLQNDGWKTTFLLGWLMFRGELLIF